MDGENEEAREGSLVMLLQLHKYLYITFELFSGTRMSMKVAVTLCTFTAPVLCLYSAGKK